MAIFSFFQWFMVNQCLAGLQMGIDREDSSGEYHGHMVDSWLNDLIDYGKT